MDITINIKAPELVNALFALAEATGKRADSVLSATAVLDRHGTTVSPASDQTAALGGQAQVVGYAATHQPTVPTGVPTHPEQAVTTQYAPPAGTYQPEQPAPVATAVPTTVQAYTMEHLAVAATQLMDAGRRTELVGLLSSFGVQALTALPKEQYGAFATQLRAMGAKI